MRISLLHATRKRPEQAIATSQIWLDRADMPNRIEHIFAIQSEDKASAEAFTAGAYNFVTTPPPPKWASSSVANWNAAAHAATGQILLVIADDLTPPQGWDTMLDPLGDIREPLAVYVPDQLSNDGLMRHPIVNREFLEKRGNIFDPAFYGVFCDNDLTVWCRSNGIKTMVTNALRFHHGFSISSGTKNEITDLQNTDEAYKYGHKIYLSKWPALVFRKVERVHCVWIGGPLTAMEKLTLALLVKHGHTPILWVQVSWAKENLCPDGVIICTIGKKVLPPIRFAGRPHPSIPSGGIGSYAQWSDYFAMDCLANDPGSCWIQLDVAAVTPLYAAANTFTTYSGGIQTCCFTLDAALAASCRDAIRYLLEHRMERLDWHDTMTTAAKILRDSNALITTQSSFKDCGCLPTSPYNSPVPYEARPAVIHWSNASHHESKHKPTPGSLYAELIAENLTTDAHV